jgi:hypothetical protein
MQFKHLSLIINPILLNADGKTSEKFAIVETYSKKLKKSQLKQLIMNCYSKGVFTSEETTLLFFLYELRSA